jgi:hypothetical protein
VCLSLCFVVSDKWTICLIETVFYSINEIINFWVWTYFVVLFSKVQVSIFNFYMPSDSMRVSCECASERDRVYWGCFESVIIDVWGLVRVL